MSDPSMAASESPPLDLLAQFAVSSPQHVATTGIAAVWKVTRTDGTPAALKIYHGADMKGEATGFDLVEALAGQGVARVYQRTETEALLEWLEGPSLGDLARKGADDQASRHIAEVAQTLHATRLARPVALTSLKRWFAALFTLRATPECTAETRHLFQQVIALADSLLKNQASPRPLHGDLHHDNIRQSPRGWLAFDAKGLLGDPAYEYANAFRNPKGADALIRDPSRITARARIFSGASGIAEKRLLEWATAKCALSIAWRAKGRLGTDPETDLLALLLKASR